MLFFFFKQKTAYEMRISDWSADVCSSDLDAVVVRRDRPHHGEPGLGLQIDDAPALARLGDHLAHLCDEAMPAGRGEQARKSVVEGKRVSVRVDLGGRRIMKKKLLHNS